MRGAVPDPLLSISIFTFGFNFVNSSAQPLIKSPRVSDPTDLICALPTGTGV